MTAPTSQRIDRWLWCARMFKTRSLAAKVVSTNGIRVTRHSDILLTEKPSFGLCVGDTISFLRHGLVTVLEVKALGERRGPAPEAQALYTDYSPPPPPKQERNVPAEREAGAGRPTKKERRSMEAFRANADDGLD